MMQGLQNKRVKVQLINLGNPNCAFNVQKAQQQKRLPNCQIFFVHETNQIWSNNRTCRARGHWQVSGCPISSHSSHHLQIAVHLFHLRSNNATSWFFGMKQVQNLPATSSMQLFATEYPNKKLYRLKMSKKSSIFKSLHFEAEKKVTFCAVIWKIAEVKQQLSAVWMLQIAWQTV